MLGSARSDCAQLARPGRAGIAATRRRRGSRPARRGLLDLRPPRRRPSAARFSASSGSPGNRCVQLVEHAARLVVQRLLHEEVDLLQLRVQCPRRARASGGGAATTLRPSSVAAAAHDGSSVSARSATTRGVGRAPPRRAARPASPARPPPRLRRPSWFRMPASRSRAPRWCGIQREHPPQVIDGALHQPVLHEHVRLRQHAPDVAEPRRQPRRRRRSPSDPDRPDSPEMPASGPELSRGRVATGRTPLADTDDGGRAAAATTIAA